MSKFRVINYNTKEMSATKSKLLTNLDTNMPTRDTQEYLKYTKSSSIQTLSMEVQFMHRIYPLSRIAKKLSDRVLEILQADTEFIKIISIYKPPSCSHKFTNQETSQILITIITSEATTSQTMKK